MQTRIKVAWFASAFVGRTASGTAQTARKIVEYALLNESKRIDIVLIAKNNYEVELIKKEAVLSQASIILLPKVKGKFFNSSRQFYKYIFKNKDEYVDVLHFSAARLYPFYWKFPAKKIFCTFHAGGEFSVPQDKFVLSRFIYNFIVKTQWKKLDKIFADSEFGLLEIVKFYGIPRSKIDIIFLGADHLWNLEASKIRLNRSKINIAVIGRWQHYKNVHSVLEAFLNLEKPFADMFHIYLIGKQNLPGQLKIQKLVDQISPEQISLFNYLDDAELKYLYQTAQLVIHPSINEGFGLPAFEAFGEGAPIAVHNDLPADYYLKSQFQVHVLNMSDLDLVTALLRSSIDFKRASVNDRRDFLTKNFMTWDQMCKRYLLTYLES
jgi:glycosyltransferase involved in cell wall biosynthesis